MFICECGQLGIDYYKCHKEIHVDMLQLIYLIPLRQSWIINKELRTERRDRVRRIIANSREKQQKLSILGWDVFGGEIMTDFLILGR